MIWLIARHTDRLAAEGDLADSWALWPIFLLAENDALTSSDFDLLIRYFDWIVPAPENVWIDMEWLPRFTRLIKLPSSWKAGLWACMSRTPVGDIVCSDFDDDVAADVLGAQGHFLTKAERDVLVNRLDSRVPDTSRIALFARTIG